MSGSGGVYIANDLFLRTTHGIMAVLAYAGSDVGKVGRARDSTVLETIKPQYSTRLRGEGHRSPSALYRSLSDSVRSGVKDLQ